MTACDNLIWLSLETATKKNENIFPLPSPEHIFEIDETLIVMGLHKDVKEVAKQR